MWDKVGGAVGGAVHGVGEGMEALGDVVAEVGNLLYNPVCWNHALEMTNTTLAMSVSALAQDEFGAGAHEVILWNEWEEWKEDCGYGRVQ